MHEDAGKGRDLQTARILTPIICQILERPHGLLACQHRKGQSHRGRVEDVATAMMLFLARQSFKCGSPIRMGHFGADLGWKLMQVQERWAGIVGWVGLVSDWLGGRQGSMVPST